MLSLFYTLQFSKIGSIISIMWLNVKLEMSSNLAEVIFIMWLWQDSNSGLTWYKGFYSFHYPTLLPPQKNGATRSRRPAAYTLPNFLPPRTSSYHQHKPDICMNRKKTYVLDSFLLLFLPCRAKYAPEMWDRTLRWKILEKLKFWSTRAWIQKSLSMTTRSPQAFPLEKFRPFVAWVNYNSQTLLLVGRLGWGSMQSNVI